jgi:hypothetical protein
MAAQALRDLARAAANPDPQREEAVMSYRNALILAAVLVVTGSCQDNPAGPSEALEPPDVIQEAAVVAEIPAEIQPGSSICRAFRAQLLELRAMMAERPAQIDLRTAGETLEAIITQTCD